MAQQTEKLVLDLDVNAAKYEEKLLRARKGLAKLKVQSLKSKGANEKLEHSIKMATKQLKIANLERQQANAMLKLQQVQLAKTTTATNKLGKSQRRSNMAFTQAAYAIDDMQYGFQGVQNNIQAMAVAMGASGPLVIGLTAVTVAVGFFVKNLKEAGREAEKLKQELAEKQGLMAKMMTLVEVVKQNEEGTEAYEEAMKKLRKNGFRGAKKDLDDYIKRLRLLMIVEAQIAAKQDKMKTLAVDREEAIQTMKDLDKIAGNIGIGEDNKLIEGKVEGGTGFLSAVNVRKYNAALKTVADTTKEMGEIAKETGKLQADLFNDDITKNKNERPKDKDKPKPLTAEDFALQDELNQALNDLEYAENDNVDAVGKLLGQQFGKTMAGEIKTALDNDSVDELLSQDFVDDAKKKMTEIDEHTKMFRDSVSGAFSDLGNTIATNLGGNGDAMSAFLGAAIGTYTKLLATNKAFLAALIPMKAAEAGANAIASGTETASKIPFGAFVLPALIAGSLAAVSSAFSSIGGGGGSVGGGGGAKPSVNTAASPNPQRESSSSARNRGGDIIIPVDQIRYGQQIGNSNYGSSS